MISDHSVMAKGVEARFATLDLGHDHVRVQMRQEIFGCLRSKPFRDLVQIEIYKILQRSLMLMGVISLVFIVLLSLPKPVDKGEGRGVLSFGHTSADKAGVCGLLS